MKLLLDQGLPRSTIQYLAGMGIAAELASLLAQVVTTAGAEIEAGAAVSVTAHRIRVRLLPIGR